MKGTSPRVCFLIGLAACGGGGVEPPADADDPPLVPDADDPWIPDADDPWIPDADDPGVDASPGDITVEVNVGGSPASGVPCAFHDPTGAPIASVLTDATGVCSYTVGGADHMVSVGFQAGTSRTVLNYQHVDPGMTIRITRAGTGSSPTLVGTEQIQLPGPVTGATRAEARNGCFSATSNDLNGTISLNGYSGCLRSGDEDSVYVEAQDAANAPVAWSSQATVVVDGVTPVTVPAWNTTFDTLDLEVIDTPAGATQLDTSCSVRIHDHISQYQPGPSVASPVAGQTYTDSGTAPAGITTRATCSAVFDQSRQCSAVQEPPFTTFQIDADDIPVPLGDFVTDMTDVTRPVFTWTEGTIGLVTPDVTTISYFATGGGNSHFWQLFAPGDLATPSLTIPALPTATDWDAFRLTGTTAVFGSDGVRKTDVSAAAGYAEYVAATPATGPGQTCVSACYNGAP